jgi:hypothetical protein
MFWDKISIVAKSKAIDSYENWYKLPCSTGRSLEN